MTIDQLTAGERFQLAALPHRTGEVVRIGDGSAVVRYGSVHKTITVKRGEEVVAAAEFDAPGRAVTISLATEVVRLDA